MGHPKRRAPVVPDDGEERPAKRRRTNPPPSDDEEGDMDVDTWRLCSLCLGPLAFPSTTRQCPHHFHGHCLLSRIEASIAPVCPVCRAPFSAVYCDYGTYKKVLFVNERPWRAVRFRD